MRNSFRRALAQFRARPSSIIEFRNDNSGSVVIIAAMSVFIIFGILGVALDFARVHNARTTIQEAADAAVLAAGTKFTAMNQAELKAYARTHFDAMAANIPSVENLTFNVTKMAETLKLDITGQYKTALLPAVGKTHFDFSVMSEITIGTGQLEVALVLDNTGSMTPHMADLKAAAKDLTNRLHAASSGSDLKMALVPYVGTVNIGSDKMAYMDTAGASAYHAHTFEGRWFGFEPGCDFTSGSDDDDDGGPGGGGGGDRTDASPLPNLFERFASAVGSAIFGSTAKAASASDVPSPYRLVGDDCWIANPNPINLFTDVLDKIPGVDWKGCVEARPAPYDVTDELPDVATPNTMFVPWVWPDEPDQGETSVIYSNDFLDDAENNLPSGGGPSVFSYEGSTYRRSRAIHKYDGVTAPVGIDTVAPETKGPNQACPDPITPLTSTKGTIISSIEAMDAWVGGGTNAHLGVVWGWRVLTPAAPFTEGAASGSATKVIVLMTDGKNNIEPHSDGAVFSDFSAYGYLTDNRLGGERTYAAYDAHINDRMIQACANAKTDDVTIYTITFGTIDSATETLYENCSSGPPYAYNATTAQDLADAFEKIGTDLTKLRLIK